MGVFAQSVGGSGGIAGDIGWTMQKFSMGRGASYSGDGGDIAVSLDAGATIATTGGNAPGIIAQSVGGGGGWIANKAGAYVGSAGGKGIGGNVGVTVAGNVTTTGYASVGVYAQSTGGADNGGTGRGQAINVAVTETGAISVGQDGQPTPFNGDGAAIYIANGTGNTVTNDGRVLSYGSVRNAVAVYSTGGDTQVVNNGTMYGDVLLTNGGGTGCFTINGTYQSGDQVTVGPCGVTNNGTIEVGRREVGTTLRISNDYRGIGRLVFDADFASGKSDRMDVAGDAEIGGTVDIRPAVMHRGSVEVMRTAGTLTLAPRVEVEPEALFRYEMTQTGGSLTVTPHATFATAAADLGDNRQAVAEHLQSLWGNGADFDAGFTALAQVQDEGVTAALDTLSGQALGLIGATRYQASLNFVDTIWSGCDPAAGGGGRCAWGQWVGTRGEMDESPDAAGYETRANGLRVGGRIALFDTTTVGAAIAYESLNAEDRGGIGRVDGDSLQIGAFGTWESGPWRLGAAAEVGYGRFDTSRHITLGGFSGEATGSTDSWHVGLHGRAAWHKDLGRGWIEPRLDLSLLRVKTGGFTETGAGPFNLRVDATSDTTLIATPAIAAGTGIGLRNGSTLRLFGSVGYALMSKDAWSPTASLAGADGFVAETPLPDRLWKIGLGAELVTSGNASLSALYNGNFGSGYDSHAAQLRFDYRF